MAGIRIVKYDGLIIDEAHPPTKKTWDAIGRMNIENQSREIKFRVYHDKWGWAESDDITMLGDGDGWVAYRGEDNDDKISTYDISDKKVHLVQYTGIKDKNWKEIYEDDMVKYGEDEEIMCEKVFSGGGAFYPVCEYPDTYMEIIGNIYDNPELTEGRM